jgi:hypothetical protein
LNGGDEPASSLTAFGLSLITDLSPPGAWQLQAFREPSLQVLSATAEEIQHNWSGFDAVGWEAMIDGAQFVVERGAEGDHRFVHGAPPGHDGVPSPQTLAIHHLSSDASVLKCAPANPADPSWWRVVLDSVLFTVALLRGYEALHAGAVATPEGAIAITATTGGGKSTLLAALLGRGLALVADDVLVLEPRDTGPAISHPGPPLMTVPATSMALLGTVDPPETIATIGDERWLAVPVFPHPLPLKALVVLDRLPVSQWPAAQPSLSKIETPVAALLGALMGFPDTPERQRARFELASAIAGTAGLWRLTARLDTPADALADALLAVEL